MKKESFFNTTPANHQTEGLSFLKKQNMSGLWNWDTGTGKTRGAFEYCTAVSAFLQGKKTKGIIFVPTSLLENWKEEAKKHIHPLVLLRIWNYCDSKKSHNIAKRAKFLEESDYGVYVAGLSYLRNTDFLKACLDKNFDFMVCDESHHLKGFKAQQTKGAITLSKKIPYKLLMTGSPLLNSLQDVWSQVHIVKPGLLSPTYYGFLNRYFFDRNAWMRDKTEAKVVQKSYHPDWVILKSRRNDLLAILNKVMHVAKKEECVDLPPYIRQQVYVEMDVETKKAYNNMLDTLRAEMDGKVFEANIALVKYMRLQQILAFSKAKQKLCLETLQSIDIDRHKVIVWCNFRQPLIELHEFVGKHLDPDKLLIAHGEIEKNKRFALIKSFNNDKNKRVIFCTQGALGTGFELTQASYAYYHSKDYKLANDLQSEGRNYRRGSDIHEQIVRIDGLVKSTIDIAVHSALRNKKGLHEMAKDISSYVGV